METTRQGQRACEGRREGRRMKRSGSGRRAERSDQEKMARRVADGDTGGERVRTAAAAAAATAMAARRAEEAHVGCSSPWRSTETRLAA
jgi:hypothetical protein